MKLRSKGAAEVTEEVAELSNKRRKITDQKSKTVSSEDSKKNTPPSAGNKS